MARPNQAEIDLSALKHNVDFARQLAPQSKLMAVVKANAYGHGAPAIAGALQARVDALAVACIEEAIELRDSGIIAPILLLEGVFTETEVEIAAQLGLWLTIDNERQLSWLERARLQRPLQCWLKVDTGMNRLGVPRQQVSAFLDRLLTSRNVIGSTVTYTHFATADDANGELTNVQLERFEALSLPAPRSAANSAGLLAWPRSHYEWVRPGYMLYGNSPLLSEHPNDAMLRPVMTLSSAVISLRDVPTGETVGYGAAWRAERPSRIATVTIGYGDGYPRQAINGTPVLVNGVRAPLAGRVSMDMITVDVTDLANVQLGDPVVLWGKGLPLSEVARCADTIGYELTTRMPARTPRVIRNV